MPCRVAALTASCRDPLVAAASVLGVVGLVTLLEHASQCVHALITVNRAVTYFSVAYSPLQLAVAALLASVGVAGAVARPKAFGRCFLTALGLLCAVLASAALLGFKGVAIHGLALTASLTPIVKYLLIALAVTPVAVLTQHLARGAPARFRGALRALNSPPTPKELALFTSAIALLLAIPYLPHVNPKGLPIDADYVHYASWVSSLSAARNPLRELLAIGCGDRPLTIALLWGLSRLLPYPYVDRVFTLTSLTLLATLTYTASHMLGCRYAYVSVLGPLLVTLYYGGFHANLLAYVLALSALIAAISGKVKVLPALSALSVMSHSEVWALYTPLFAGSAKALLMWVAPGLAWHALRLAVLGPGCVSAVASGVGFVGLSELVGKVGFEVEVYLWGTLNCWSVYAVAIAGYYFMARDGHPMTLQVAASMAPLLLSLFLTPYVTARALVNSATWLPVAYLFNKVRGFEAVLAYAGIQLLWVAWYLVNAVPQL